MTNDATALQERIARALYENAEYYGPAPTQPPWDWRDDEERGEWMEIAAAVLPVIAAEVRAAKAEALREAAGPEWGNSNTLWGGPRVRAKITRRATEYETGDRT